MHKILLAFLILGLIQGCLFFDDDPDGPTPFSGIELKALVPPLRSDTSVEEIGARDYRASYPICDIDSSKLYIDTQIFAGWTKGAVSSFNIYGLGGLYKQTLSKNISGRNVSLNVRCSDGYEGKYSSALYISN